MLTIQSLIQNAKQLSKTYEKNAVKAECVMQQIARLEATATESVKPPEQRHQSSKSKEARPAQAPVTTNQPIPDPKAMMASLNEQHVAEQAAAILARKGSNTSKTSQNQQPQSETCLMHAIQRESNQVRTLKRENIILKQQLHEYEFTLELIMSKYRAQMLELLRQTKSCNESILSQHESSERLGQQSKNIHLSNRIQEMKSTFEGGIAPTNERKIEQQQEMIKELLMERESLVELYQIAHKYGSLPEQLERAKADGEANFVPMDQRVEDKEPEKESEKKEVEEEEDDEEYVEEIPDYLKTEMRDVRHVPEYDWNQEPSPLVKKLEEHLKSLSNRKYRGPRGFRKF